MNVEKHWVLIERLKLDTDLNALHIFGSIQKMVDFGIVVNDKRLSYAALQPRLKKNRYWRTDKYIIKECEIERSRRK